MSRVHPIFEYIAGLGRDHAEALRCLGAVLVFALLVIAARQLRGP